MVAVAVVITDGVTVIVALRTPVADKICNAFAVTSAGVLPGTIPNRAASYAACSTECLAYMNRANSRPPRRMVKNSPAHNANSTVNAPARMLDRHGAFRSGVFVFIVSYSVSMLGSVAAIVRKAFSNATASGAT